MVDDKRRPRTAELNARTFPRAASGGHPLRRLVALPASADWSFDSTRAHDNMTISKHGGGRRDAEVHTESTPETTFAVYVAAAATPSAVARVAAAIAMLRADGFVVTCTWPEIVAKVGNANPRDASDTDRRGWSTQDLTEIDAADAVWFLVPEPPETTRGAWYEAGYADSEKKHLVFSGDTKQSVFCARGAEFATDAGALCYLRSLRAGVLVEAGLRELAEAPALDLRVKNLLLGSDSQGAK